MLGTVLKDRYRVEAKLGEGGMGVVYKAHDTLLNRPVALKSLTPALVGEEGIRRLMREAQSAAQLNHPNIVAVHDVIDDGQARLIVMEYVEGGALAELIPLEVPRAVDLALQVCRALEYAHGRGIVHRDIKPENILVADGVAKVTDFGLARSEGRSRLTQSGLIVGTVAYMAPEQVLGGTVDARSDLYALGCVLYEALTGRKPFEGDDPFTVLSQQVNVMPVAPRWHNSAIPATLDAIIMRLLAKDPAERYGSAAQVIEALELVTGADAAEAVELETPTTRTTLLERIVRGKLVGRAAEVRELREHLDRVLSGEGRLVLISGEPGIGKTRLAEELAVYAHLRSAWVLRGHCYEQEVGVPYLPIVEALRQLHRLSGQILTDQLGDRAEDLARLLPEVGQKRAESPSLTPEDERIRVFEAVTQWVMLASRLHPLVFILDDVHWADRASLRLLHHLARSVRPSRVLILGTYREMELDLEHPLNDVLSQMNRERLYYRLPLRRLSEEDTRTLLSGLFDVSVSEELAGAVYQETEGNPFFIEEVVKALVEEGKIYREGGRWERLKVEELEIPQSVKAAIGRRLQKATEPCRRVLTIAAVIGREFDPEVLMKLSGLEENEALDALDEGLRLQLIREAKVGRAAGYTFEHALIRQTLYEALNIRRRARLHQQVGEALEVLYGARLEDHIEELAYHFGEAGPATAAKGVEYNLRAARRAGRLYALEEAERRLTVALELAESMDDPKVRMRVLEALGDLYLLFADNRRASDAYQRALEGLKARGDETSADAVRLYLRIAEASAGFWIEALPEAAVYSQKAVDLLKDQPDAPMRARALSLLAMHRARAGDVASARLYAEQAIDLAARLGDPKEQAVAHRAMAMVHRYAGEWGQLHLAVQRWRSLLKADFTPADADLYVDLIPGYFRTGRHAEMERAAREFLEIGEKLRSPMTIYRACAFLVYALFEVNKWDEALRFADRTIEIYQRLQGDIFTVRQALSLSGRMYAARGEEERVRDRIAQLDALRYELPPEHQSPRQNALEIAVWAEVPDLVAPLLPRAEPEQPRCLTCKYLFHTALAEGRLLVGDVDGARARREQAERDLPASLDSWNWADSAHLRGLIAEAGGDRDSALEHFQEALRAVSSLPWDINRAKFQESAGRVYLARNGPGDHERGRQLLTEVSEFYQRLGARRFEQRVQRLLARAEESG